MLQIVYSKPTSTLELASLIHSDAESASVAIQFLKENNCHENRYCSELRLECAESADTSQHLGLAKRFGGCRANINPGPQQLGGQHRKSALYISRYWGRSTADWRRGP